MEIFIKIIEMSQMTDCLNNKKGAKKSLAPFSIN